MHYALFVSFGVFLMYEKQISKQNMKELIDKLDNEAWDARVRAVLNLNNYHDPKVTEALIGKLKDDNENVWISAANVLKNRKDPRIVDSLILTISDNRDEIRWHSVYYLGEMGDKKAVDPIIKALKDKNVEVRINAAKALGKIGDNKASFSQTSKGVWYCNELTIYCQNIFDGISIGEQAIIYTKEVLNEVNKTEEQTKKEK